MPLEGDAALPAGGAGPGVLAAGEALQPQLRQEETVFGTGEPTRPRTPTLVLMIRTVFFLSGFFLKTF